MSTEKSYNQIAGQSVERIAALSDGVFAIAMTLLVLDLRVPASNAIRSEHDLWAALIGLAPRLVPYVMSFLTLGIFWVGQQTQLNSFTRGDRNLAWISILFLFGVSLVPFSTALLAQYITYRVALLVCWGNILLLGTVLYGLLRYAYTAGMIESANAQAMLRANERRIVGAQVLYGIGAALCVFGTFVSIGFIVLVQLNYAIAPRIRGR